MLCHIAQMTRPYSSACKFSHNASWLNLVDLVVDVLIHFEGSLIWLERQFVIGISVRRVAHSIIVVLLLLA